MPFACSTNLMARLDPAALQALHLQSGFPLFDAGPAPHRLSGPSSPRSRRRVSPDLDRLTPADFALVGKKLRYLPRESEPAEPLALLRAECALKPGESRPIGFALPPPPDS